MTFTLPQNQQISNPSSLVSPQRSSQNELTGRESNSPIHSIFSTPEALFSESANGIDELLQSFQCTSEVTRQRLLVEESDQAVVDYSYMDRACALASNAPGMKLSEEQTQAYIGLHDFSYFLDEDD